jgi:hypothetical protein
MRYIQIKNQQADSDYKQKCIAIKKIFLTFTKRNNNKYTLINQ